MADPFDTRNVGGRGSHTAFITLPRAGTLLRHLHLRAVLAIATLALAAPAFAQDAPLEVTLHREAPFDRWCVKPLCQGQPDQRESHMKVPPPIAIAATEGLLEQRLRRALSDSLESAAKAMLGSAYNEAIADVAEALAATSDPQRLERLGGLGAAVMRAALTFHLETALPRDATCAGERRLDAIYEGLALSVALAPLDFPQRKGRASSGCTETTMRTARAVDAAVLAAVLTDEARRDAIAVVRSLEDAKENCTSVPNAIEATLIRVRAAGEALRASSVKATAASLRALRSAPPPAAAPEGETASAPSAEEEACTKALDALAAIDPARLDALSREGLSDAPLEAVVASFRVESQGASSLVVRIATGAATDGDMRTLVEALVRAAGLPADVPVLRDAVQALPKAIVVDNGSATVDPNALLAFLATQYGVDEDGKPSLRSLLGVPTTPWAFELNGGLPDVDFGDEKVVGDLSFGYATKKFGVIGRGWLDTYNIDDSLVHNDYTHTGGSVEGWWLSDDGLAKTGKLRLELRLTGGFDYYDTTSYPIKDALSQFYDFDSRMGRGTAFVGIRYGAPPDRVSFQVLGGGGGQYEDPDTTKFTGGRNLSLSSQQNLTVQGAARIRVRVRLVPQIFGIRVRGDSTYFSITREQLSVALASGALSTTSVVEQQQQIELHGRLFLDADIASVAGFVPAVFAGIDYIGISGSATSTSAAIPILGVGIVRQSW